MSSAFDNCAAEYEQYRPGYPEMLFEDFIAAFGLTPASVVIDVGTGTGRAALRLAARGPCVIGLDPSPPMLDHARRAAAVRGLTNVEFHSGTAEATGLPDHAADAIIMAQAFHWVDPPKALAEFQRILKPGGGLAIFWNQRDLSEPYLKELEALIVRYNPQHQLHYRNKPWSEIIAGSGRFHNVRYKQYRHASQVPPEAVVGVTRSYSYVRNALNEEATAAFERDLRALLTAHAHAGMVNLPYLTDVWYAEATR